MKRTLRNTLWRSLWFVLGALGLVLISSASYQALMTARDLRTFLPPGELVDVGGHRLHGYLTERYVDDPEYIEGV